MPAASGHGSYWFVPVDAGTGQEGDPGPAVDHTAAHAAGGAPGTVPGYPSMALTYVHTDHLGSVRLLTDEQGVSRGERKYHPFGHEVEGSDGETRMRFTGHERDDGVGLDYMRARYYAPALGRFLGVDPAIHSARPQTPQSWSRHSYTVNSPIVHTDPSGEEILVKVHPVVGDASHASVLIIPENQQRYTGDDRFETDDGTGQVFATLGAGPSGFPPDLVSGIGRDRDVDLTITEELVIVNLGDRPEDEVIEALFAADANYGDDDEYDALAAPEGQRRWWLADDGFNSNSYVSGLLQAVGLAPPPLESSTPGYDVPLPADRFVIRDD